MELPLIDEKAHNEAKELLGSKFENIIAYFLEDSADYIAKITAAHTEHNYAAMILPAHSLKSSSKQVGAMLLSDIAKAIEQKTKISSNDSENNNKNQTEIAELVDKLQSTFKKTHDILSAV